MSLCTPPASPTPPPPPQPPTTASGTAAETTDDAVRRAVVAFVRKHGLYMFVHLRMEGDRPKWSVRLGFRRLHLCTRTADTESEALLGAMTTAAAKIDSTNRIAVGGFEAVKGLLAPGFVGIAGLAAAALIAFPAGGIATDDALPPPPPKHAERAAPTPLFAPEFTRA